MIRSGGRHIVIPDIMQVKVLAPRTAAAAAAAASWWEVTGKTCVGAWQAKGAASLAASYVNLANPGTYDCTAPVAAPSFDAGTGWTFNGSTQYLSTGWTPATGQDQAMIVRFSDYTSGDDSIVGVYLDTGGLRTMNLARSGTTTAFRNGEANSVAGGAIDAGTLAVSGDTGYQDGIAVLGVISTSAVAYDQPIYIGANCYNAGAVTNYFDGKIQAFAIYSDTLAAGEVKTVSDAMALL